MKKVYIVMAALTMAVSMTACQSSRTPSSVSGTIAGEPAVVENQVSNGILIAYLPGGDETSVESGERTDIGATETAAQMIGEVTGGSPVVIGETESYQEDYGTVFLGVSSQISERPELLREFLEQNDLSGKTIIPFDVSGGSMENLLGILFELEPEAEFLDGISMDATSSADMQLEINEWLSGLGYNN